jgi:DNA replication and repair protein RecF
VYTLSLSAFRCHDDFAYTFQPGLCVIKGKNGTGKTSVLEALSLLSPGKGLRSADSSDVQQQESTTPWRVQLTIDSDCGPMVCATQMVNQRRKMTMNDEVLRAHDHMTQWLKMVWPMHTIHTGLTQRRACLNRLVFMVDTGYVHHLRVYERALKERNRLLKNNEQDGHWFDSLDQTLATEGVQIMHKRRCALDTLMQEMACHETPFARPALSTVGGVETMNDVTIDGYCAALLQCRSTDRMRGQTTFGVHKSRFLMVHPNGLDVGMCSSGERQSLLLSVALAALRLSHRASPDAHHFFLADEAMAYLDLEKQDWLWHEMTTIPASCWVTGLPQLTVPQGVDTINLPMTDV